MKRFAAILLLTIMLINGTGFYVYYAVQLWRIHENMKEALKELSESELLALPFTKSLYEQAKVEDDELRIEGKMYDIAKVVVQGDSLVVYCVHDEKEDNLVALMEEIVTKPIKMNDSLFQSISAMIGMMYLNPYFEIYLCTFVNERVEESIYHFSLKTSSPVLETPPPLV